MDVFDWGLENEEMEAIDALNKNRRYNDPGVFCEKAFGRFFPIYDWAKINIIWHIDQDVWRSSFWFLHQGLRTGSVSERISALAWIRTSYDSINAI